MKLLNYLFPIGLGIVLLTGCGTDTGSSQHNDNHQQTKTSKSSAASKDNQNGSTKVKNSQSRDDNVSHNEQQNKDSSSKKSDREDKKVKGDSSENNTHHSSTDKHRDSNSDLANNVVKHNFSNAGKAEQKIQEVWKNKGLRPTSDSKTVDLGHEIHAKKGGALHHIAYQWNEGRWHIEIITGEDNLNKGYNNKHSKILAKKIVAYLDNHQLPVPHKKGLILIDDVHKNATKTTIYWQENRTVYHIKNQKTPIDSIKKAVSTKSTSN